MALKDEWKDTGKGLGGAFKDLGKNLVRSVKTGIDKVDDSAAEENVFNDGSWRETGKELGGAFKNLGKSVLHSAKTGLDKADGDSKDPDEKPEQ